MIVYSCALWEAQCWRLMCMVSFHPHDNFFTDGETKVKQIKLLAEPRMESEDDSGPTASPASAPSSQRFCPSCSSLVYPGAWSGAGSLKKAEAKIGLSKTYLRLGSMLVLKAGFSLWDWASGLFLESRGLWHRSGGSWAVKASPNSFSLLWCSSRAVRPVGITHFRPWQPVPERELKPILPKLFSVFALATSLLVFSFK